MDRRSFLRYAFAGGAATLAGCYPVFIERNLVQINRYTIPVANLPRAFHGFTLAHLTDIHLGFLVSENFVEGIVEKTNKLKTDAIVCTGDFVHNRNTTEEIDKVWPILSKLTAKYGVYSVLGNHDHTADTNRSLYWLERSGQNLRHRQAAITKGKERLVLGGAGDYLEDSLEIDKAFATTDENDCRILLSHNPDSIDTSYSTPLSLVISGHTHGGQVILPFIGPPILPVDNKIYSSGFIIEGPAPIFISRGIGWAIYPIRFNCYPEIAVLQLVSSKLVS